MSVIAVDFDGTLSVGARYPELGVPNKTLFEYLSERQEHGDTLILWTCRHDELLHDAVDWCSSFGLNFDYVNENPEWAIAKFGDSRKIFADTYIDDKSTRWCKGQPNVDKPQQSARPAKPVDRRVVLV